MIGVLLARLLWTGAVLGGLAGFGGGVLVLVIILAAAVASLAPLWWMPVDEAAAGPEAEARQLLNSL